MRKIYFLGLMLSFITLSAQKQSQQEFFFGNDADPFQMSAQMIIDDTSGQAGLVISAPADRWFAIGFGTTVVSGFSMGSGDVIVYTTATTPTLTDRKFIGGGTEPAIDPTQNWNVVQDNVFGNVRTMTLTRPLNTGDADDFAIDYATTNSLNVAWAVAPSGNTWTLAYHGNTNRGFAVLNFTTMSTNESVKEETKTEVVPTQITSTFEVKSNREVLQVEVYDINGRSVYTSKKVENNDISSLAAGVYFVQVGLKNGETHYEKIVKK